MERARHLLTYSTHSWIRLARLETCQWRTLFTKELSFVKTKKYTHMDTRTRMHTSTAFKAKNGKRNEGGNHKQTFIVYLTDFKLYKLDSNNLNHPQSSQRHVLKQVLSSNHTHTHPVTRQDHGQVPEVMRLEYLEAFLQRVISRNHKRLLPEVRA